MKKIIALTLIAVICAAIFAGCGGGDDNKMLSQIMKEKKLVVALSPDFAPMEFVDTSKTGQEQYVGFDVSLAKYIAQELGVELVIEAMDFTSCQAAVQLGSVNMSISGYSATDERKENFAISDYYYAGDNESHQCIMVLKDRQAELSTAEAFAGKNVAAQNASLQMNLLTSQLPDANPVAIVDLGTAVLELISGKVDALCVAKGNGEAFIANYPELALSDWEFTVEDEGNVILIPKGETALLEKVNEILQKAYDAGYYGPWYDEAKELSGSATAQELSIPEEGSAE